MPETPAILRLVAAWRLNSLAKTGVAKTAPSSPMRKTKMT
jgi:hypothetical protein